MWRLSNCRCCLQDRNLRFPTGGGDASRITATARRKLGTLGTALDSLQALIESPDSAIVYVLAPIVKQHRVAEVSGVIYIHQQFMLKSHPKWRLVCEQD